MLSFDSIETYVYGMSKDLVSEKEVIKYDDIIKRLKWLTLINNTNMLQKKTWKNIIQIGHKFLIIHTEYQ